jgi:hypothetical protein
LNVFLAYGEIYVHISSAPQGTGHITL